MYREGRGRVYTHTLPVRYPLYTLRRIVQGGRLCVYPVNMVCLPLSYSGNPGVKRRNSQGGRGVCHGRRLALQGWA